MKKVHLTKMYARYRIREPKEFIKSSFRTHDVGRVGHTKRIAGRLKKTRKWETQAIIISRADYNKGLRVGMLYGKPKLVRFKLRKVV